MERHYTFKTVMLALEGSVQTVNTFHRAVFDGRLAARPFSVGKQKVWTMSVLGIQVFLARSNRASCPEWLLRNLLDLAADRIITRSNDIKGLTNFQQIIDRETGYADSNA